MKTYYVNKIFFVLILMLDGVKMFATNGHGGSRGRIYIYTNRPTMIDSIKLKTIFFSGRIGPNNQNHWWFRSAVRTTCVNILSMNILGVNILGPNNHNHWWFRSAVRGLLEHH